MGTLKVNSSKVGQVSEFKVENIIEDHECLHLTIISNVRSVKYRITADVRHKDLNIVKKDLEKLKLDVLNGDYGVKIREDLERFYIHITYPNSSKKQYTAQKLLGK